MDIKFYYVKPEYIEHLKNAELQARGFTCVPNVTYANREKFFYGAVIEKKNGICYYVPISSQIKNDANSIIIKTDDKINNIKGSLRFAYMIPVPRQMLIPVNFNEVDNQNRRRLLQKELAFCRRNRDKIRKQATKTFISITQASSQKIKNNSCDFDILEKAYLDFCIKNNILLPVHQNKTATDTTQNKPQVKTQSENQSSKKTNPKH